jgi:hypothetical protein
MLLLSLLSSVGITRSETTSCAIPEEEIQEINYQQIINQGFTVLQANNIYCKVTDETSLINLEQWYSNHPNIAFASLIKNTMTIKFIDNTYTLLLDFPQSYSANYQLREESFPLMKSSTVVEQNNAEKTALILNPSEYLYGTWHTRKITRNLERIGYTVIYKANEEVDLRFTEQNLTAEVIYMNTHAGYWDTDGDHTPDTVVIATGEHWTNTTPTTYKFEYTHNLIVKGMVGDHAFIAFTPPLIEHYYVNETLPNSLVYMATCEACYDDSMANPFLNAGAAAYIGWSGTTMSWTNSITSVIAFRLFKRRCTVHQVCAIIRYGGFYNRIFRSKLSYYGDGNLRITTAKTVTS